MLRNDEIRGYIPSREEFASILDGLRDARDAADRLDRLIADTPAFSESADFFGGYALVASNVRPLLDLLGTVFGDADDDIGYYCHEIDFGRGWRPGCIVGADGEDIDISDAGKLYDHLVANLGAPGGR